VQVEEALAERGASGARAASVATLASRAPKVAGLSAPELVPEWRARAAELGFDREQLAGSLGRTRATRLRPAEVARLVGTLAGPDGLTAHASSFGRPDVLRALAERAGPAAGAVELEAAADAFLGSRRVLALAEPGIGGQQRYTTPELLQVERELLRQALGRRSAGAGVVAPEAVRDVVERRPTLSEEQGAMVRRLLADGDGVAVVVGRAGAGKTYALDPARAAWEAGGFQVVGAAPAARAAAELEAGAGIPSMTVRGCCRSWRRAGCSSTAGPSW
jgi:hypothetical protein